MLLNEFLVFDIRGLVHYEFVPRGQAINKEYYLSGLRRLRENINNNFRKLSGLNLISI